MTESDRKAEEAENQFRQWLDFHKIPHLYIEQRKDRLSVGLKEIFGAKRPDFIVLVEGLGLILIDVKNRRFQDDGFEISTNDLKKYANLEKHFNFKVWFAVSGEELKFATWYWISVRQANAISKPKKVFRSNRFFYITNEIFLRDCIRIEKSDSNKVLISKLLKV